MAIATFWSNGREQTGKTLSIVAIATYMAIENNMKILIISTNTDDRSLRNCYFDNQTGKRTTFGILGPRGGEVTMQSGMEGLVRIAKSNKVTTETVRNYTKAVFKDALEILFSGDKSESPEDVSKYYPEIIKAANEYYDMIFVDLDANIDQTSQEEIMKISNVVVANITQRLSSVNRFKAAKQKNEILASKKTLVLAGKYDNFSRYTIKNVARYLGEKTVLAIPYNTLFYDSAEEAQVPDMFFNFAKNKNLDKEDSNYLFFKEVSRAAEVIQYRIQELQMRM